MPYPRALIGVDIQPDFCEGGRLPVPGGNVVAAKSAVFLEEYADTYDQVVFSQDWHVDPGDHWSDMPDFQTSFPVHCPADDPASDIHPLIDLAYVGRLVRKGASAAAFSAFDGVTDRGLTLDECLQEDGITDIDVIGLAADFCVKATCLGGVAHGYKTRLLLPLTAAVGGERALAETVAELEARGVVVVHTLAGVK